MLRLEHTPAQLNLAANRLQPALLNHARHLAVGAALDPEDLVQSAWLQWCQANASYQTDRGLVAWLKASMRHLVLDAAKRKGIEVAFSLDDPAWA